MTRSDMVNVTVLDGTEETKLTEKSGTTVGDIKTKLNIDAGKYRARLSGHGSSAELAEDCKQLPCGYECTLEFIPQAKEKAAY